ncbi:uncharacterized protein LOC114444602 [Parambassis ranga]|uniref:Uncharacterized protein LOC114444602 n=1 Tax=Parambassis ranga TaxID=210632 RepID=A0A6P7JE91_9TELE|nr:uncharacterized protein LOC114444602 [Parambassis ranga]XP_028275120.1 uncharacterized protein LOC114444602 [Parambassis ranga]
MATRNITKHHSSKHQDIISNSTVVSAGRPAVFQLKPKKETFGTLTRLTVGEKNVNKTNRSILLVGESGAGKSTLINALVNYSMGVKFEDDVWFQIVENEKSPAGSRASDVMVYEIFGFEGQTLPYSLTIIDTPAYESTGGTGHNVIINQRLLDLFRSEDGVHEVHAVGLVMKATDNQLSDQVCNVVNSVMSLFGKDMEENIVALITHSDETKPENALQALEAANVKCSRNQKNQPVYFLFDNKQHTERTKQNEFELENAQKVTEKGICEFTALLERSRAQQLETTFGLNASIRLAGCIQNLEDRIKLNELKQTEIRQITEALKKHEEKKNEKFEVNEVYKEKENIKSGKWGVFYEAAVCCTVCEENCHYPGCTMARNPEQCEVMNRGCCNSCRGKCLPSAHVKEKWKYVTKTRRVQRTAADLKQRYENAERNLLENLNEEMKRLTAEKSQLLDESCKCVLKLEQITLKVDSVSSHVHLNFLIEKMKERGDTEKLQKLQEIDSRMDEGTRAILQYMKMEETQQEQQTEQQDTQQMDPPAASPTVDLKTMCNINIPSKYKDLMSISTVVSTGRPAVIQLRPKKEKFGTMTRLTVGERNVNKTNRTILLVGESGAGKSTLINTLFNYSMGVKSEEEVWFQIVEDEKRSQAESQTSDVTVYQIFESQTLPYSLTIIDTPGYADTRGLEHDINICQRLLDLFRSEDGVHEVHAVGLVMKASNNRLSDRLSYVFDSVMSLFGKDMEKNIVALITHSDGMKPKNALQALEAGNVKCSRNKNNQPVYFLFDNCQHEDRAEEPDDLEDDNLSEKGMTQFTDFLEKTEAQKLKKTVEVMNERIRLTACIQNLQDRIELTELKQTEITQITEALKEHEKEKFEKKKDEKFKVEVDEHYKDKEPINTRVWGLMFIYEGAVCCTVCEENCHYPGCTMAKSPKDCEVMKDGRCTSCRGKCPVSAHVKEKWKYVTKMRRVQRSETLIRQASPEKDLTVLENLQKEMKRLTAEKSQLLDESYQHVVTLERTALNVASVSTFVHLDFLIDKMKESEDTEKIKKLHEVKNRVDEGTKSALQYIWAKLTKVGKILGKGPLQMFSSK